MKKKLESELMSIAHRILKLKGKEDVEKMHEEVAVLYEKLTVLKFAQENFDEKMPTIGADSSFFGMLDEAFNNTVSDTVTVDDQVYVNLDETEKTPITEPLMEKIKDIVAQMPEESQQVDDLFSDVIEPKANGFKNDFEEITADFKEMPVFEPVEKEVVLEEKKSLNDKLKSGLMIGLNDRLAFVNHLFDGQNEDYERVLSQINTSDSFEDAQAFIQDYVKPDHNNWVGKEAYEERFLEIVSAKFN
ncbi:MAG: hypothetical protein BM564_11590 [Bacteroidetes bacterium MedPE-SWsnd-G2]|nr:MAG: hypothetical protein BM564_11590 [Bacteroidetes bacterium MedPE-SWsnd-G2]